MLTAYVQKKTQTMKFTQSQKEEQKPNGKFAILDVKMEFTQIGIKVTRMEEIPGHHNC